MNKYRVYATETVTYVIEVEAADKDDASEAAGEIWAHSENPDEDFHGTGHGIEIDEVSLIEGEEDEDGTQA